MESTVHRPNESLVFLPCTTCGVVGSPLCLFGVHVTKTSTTSVRRKRGRPRKDPNASAVPKPPKLLLPAFGSPQSVGQVEAPQHRQEGGGDNKRQRLSMHERDQAEAKDQAKHVMASASSSPSSPSSSFSSLSCRPKLTLTTMRLLVDELIDMKHNVKSMQKQFAKLSSQQFALDDRQHELSQRLDKIAVAAARESLHTSDLMLPTTSTLRSSFAPPGWAAREQFLRSFPFLAPHELDKRPGVPFVIDDLQKPFTLSRLSLDSSQPLSVFVYCSPSLCSLLEYELHELQGCDSFSVVYLQLHHYRQLRQAIVCREQRDVTGVLPYHGWLRAKNGTFIKSAGRLQTFFDADGNVTWTLVCIDRTAPEHDMDEIPPPTTPFDFWNEEMANLKSELFPSSPNQL